MDTIFWDQKIAVVEQDLIRPTSFSREHSILLLLAERLPDDYHQFLVRGEVAALEPLPERLVAVDAGRDDGDCGSHFRSRDDHLVLRSFFLKRVFAGEVLGAYCIISVLHSFGCTFCMLYLERYSWQQMMHPIHEEDVHVIKVYFGLY